METGKPTERKMDMIIFTRPSNGKKFVSYKTKINAAFADVRNMIAADLEAGRTDGKKISSMKMIDNGEWTVEADGKITTFGVQSTTYTPTVREASSARIDSAMDGGYGSMGMLK